jgi:hypothetical protein
MFILLFELSFVLSLSSASTARLRTSAGFFLLFEFSALFSYAYEHSLLSLNASPLHHLSPSVVAISCTRRVFALFWPKIGFFFLLVSPVISTCATATTLVVDRHVHI